MLSAHHVAWRHMEAERAFGKAKRKPWRGRHRALEVHDVSSLAKRGPARSGVREIPLTAIRGTFDPGRARQFDAGFRPVERTRRRWLSVWVADGLLPPISVMQIGDSFAVLDGHHRVSVAIARGDTTISATVA